MSNWTRLGISAVLSLIPTVIAYMLPFTFMLYFFAPGFWLGDVLPASLVSKLGGDLFPVFASAIIWMLVIFLILWLISRRRGRNYR
ncbi:MAG: hypothetical protein QOJ64_4476 [Acidobacteriota bacterium]|jgi:hypothetical protein|nr:hypothetical protein [Acidobacteriota bacterium]